MKVKDVAELISENEIAIETMDAECRCVDFIGDDINKFIDYKVEAIFTYNNVIYKNRSIILEIR